MLLGTDAFCAVQGSQGLGFRAFVTPSPFHFPGLLGIMPNTVSKPCAHRQPSGPASELVTLSPSAKGAVDGGADEEGR